jgi:hypothetical protein
MAAKQKEQSIGLEFSGYKYCEFGDKDKEIMNIKGERLGLSYEYLSRKNTKEVSFWAYEGSFSLGNVLYNGSSQNKLVRIRVNCYLDFYVEHRLLYGLVLIPFNNEYLAVMLYLGCGFRNLFNRISDFYYIKEDGSPGKISGYNRYSTYFYIPLGIKLRTDLNNGWLFSVNPEFDWVLLGYQISDIDDGSGKAMKNAQHKGYGLRASITISKKMNNKYTLFFEPFVKYWNINISEKKSIIVEENGVIKHKYYFEPKNNALEYGSRVGIVF